ncbi:MAG TPA: hypothetical protein VGL60_04105 [Acidimicrobiales bacterium]
MRFWRRRRDQLARYLSHSSGNDGPRHVRVLSQDERDRLVQAEVEPAQRPEPDRP